MAPVIKALEANPRTESLVVSTGQHRELLAPVLQLFDIALDVDLDLMDQVQGLNQLFAAVVARMSGVLAELKPDVVLVHGDTTTAAATATACFHARVPVAHIEAGLRSGDMNEPWPEEMNRRLIDLMSWFMFAPTQSAALALKGEGVPAERIEVTGNTVVDALFMVADQIRNRPALRHALEQKFSFLPVGENQTGRIVLVTGHRRENFGDGMQNICRALYELAQDPGTVVVWPVHLNPGVREPVRQFLGNTDRVHLIDPVGYREFVFLMLRCAVILTDSGGVQEEAASLGKPVLILRNVTERPEVLEQGGQLVGTEFETIVRETRKTLGALNKPRAVAENLFGDGMASERIVARLCAELSNRLVSGAGATGHYRKVAQASRT